MGKLILFGATGDLACSKLFPALAEIGGILPIIAVGRRPYTNSEFFENHLPDDGALRRRVTYRQMDFTDTAGYQNLFDQDGGNIVYLSVTPQAVTGIIEQIGALELPRNPAMLRLVLEKPFGRDETSAGHLEELLEKHFALNQIVRIDHYLLKDGVELARRLQKENSSLNGDKITSLNIRILEQEGIGTRGAFYSTTGAIRDIVQNHLLNVAAVVLVGEVRADFFDSLKITDALFGQYQGFTSESAVPPASTTETYARIRFQWNTVVIVCETGKALEKQIADMSFQTKNGVTVEVEIQPKTGFTVTGEGDTLRYTLPQPVPDAYVRLFERLYENRLEDVSLEPAAIGAAWNIADQLAELNLKQKLIIYPAGSRGPA